MNQNNTNQDNSLKITIIGSEGTGKSCFLGGLAVLGLDAQNSGYLLHCNDKETATYFRDLRESLIRYHAWPNPTSMTNLLKFNLSFAENNINLITLDYGGEHFRVALNSMSPEDVQAFFEHLIQSKILLFLVDAEEAYRADSSTDTRYALGEKLSANLVAIQEAYTEFRKSNTDKFSRLELGIVLTKADRVPDLAQALASPQNANRIAQAFGEQFVGKQLNNKIKGIIKTNNINYFAISSVGRAAVDETGNLTSQSELIQPEGYNALFSWIAQHKIRRTGRWLLATIAMILVIAGIAVFLGVGGIKIIQNIYEQRVKAGTETIDNVDKPTVVIITDPKVTTVQDDETIKKKLEEKFAKDKSKLELKLENTNDVKTITELRDNDIQKLIDAYDNNHETWKTDLEILKNKCTAKIEALEFEEVQTLFDQNKDKECLEKAQKFIQKYPQSVNREKVQGYIDSIKKKELETARKAIRNIPNTPDTYESKRKKINEFIKEYGDRVETERPQMEKVSNMMKALLEGKQCKVTITECGGFNYAEDQKLIVRLNGKEILTTESKKGKTITLQKVISFKWKHGDTIEFEIQAYGGKVKWDYYKAASKKFDGFEALRVFSDGQIHLYADPNSSPSWAKYQDAQGFFVKFDVTTSPYSADDWKAFDSYFIPGEAW